MFFYESYGYGVSFVHCKIMQVGNIPETAGPNRVQVSKVFPERYGQPPFF